MLAVAAKTCRHPFVVFRCFSFEFGMSAVTCKGRGHGWMLQVAILQRKLDLFYFAFLDERLLLEFRFHERSSTTSAPAG